MKSSASEWKPFQRFKGLKKGWGLVLVESVLSLSSWFTSTPLKYFETNNSNTT